MIETTETPSGIVVRLPRSWHIRAQFRRALRRACPIAPWTWLVTGKRAIAQVERFRAGLEAAEKAEARRRAWEANEREWEQAT